MPVNITKLTPGETYSYKIAPEDNQNCWSDLRNFTLSKILSKLITCELTDHQLPGPDPVKDLSYDKSESWIYLRWKNPTSIFDSILLDFDYSFSVNIYNIIIYK